MPRIALYSKQYALYIAKFRAIQAREGNNVCFTTLPGIFRAAGILEMPNTYVTNYFRDLDTHKIVEATHTDLAENRKGLAWPEERITKLINRYKEQWPDATVVSRNAQFQHNGRNWQEILKANHLDLEAVLVETRSDKSLRILHTNARKAIEKARDPNADGGPV